MPNSTSQHILNTAGNLLGFCLIVITSLQISDKAASSIIDEVTSVIAVALIFSCLFSYMSIRTKNPKREEQFERIADNVFVISLGGILLVILLIAFNFLR